MQQILKDINLHTKGQSIQELDHVKFVGDSVKKFEVGYGLL